MNFNHSITKQAQEIIICQKINKNILICSWKKWILEGPSRRYLINKHIGRLTTETTEHHHYTITVSQYESFSRPHLDYQNILPDKTYKPSFYEKLVKCQNSALSSK